MVFLWYFCYLVFRCIFGFCRFSIVIFYFCVYLTFYFIFLFRFVCSLMFCCFFTVFRLEHFSDGIQIYIHMCIVLQILSNTRWCHLILLQANCYGQQVKRERKIRTRSQQRGQQAKGPTPEGPKYTRHIII